MLTVFDLIDLSQSQVVLGDGCHPESFDVF